MRQSIYALTHRVYTIAETPYGSSKLSYPIYPHPPFSLALITLSQSEATERTGDGNGDGSSIGLRRARLVRRSVHCSPS